MFIFNNKRLFFIDNLFRVSLKIVASLSIVIILLFFFVLLLQSLESISNYGFTFWYSKTWNPSSNTFGALPFIVGTFITSILALLISFPFSVSISLFLGFILQNEKLKSILQSIVDLLAGIPSVIYGFWGLMVLVPLIISVQSRLGIVPYGVGLFTASIILSLMILPYSISLTKEVIELIPSDIKEAAFSLGATRFEVIRYVIIPQVKSGIFAGQLMAFGRAISETMAVTMVIGNRNLIPKTLFDPANTLASVLANEFAEATGSLYISSLIQLALILFLISIFVNYVGGHMIKKFA